MSTNLFSPNKEFSNNADINSVSQYQELYKKSILDPDTFWAEIAERITWFKKWDQVREYDFVKGSIKWFEGAKLNVSYNCLDRHDPFEKYLNEICKKETCISPIPSLSIHMANAN